KALAVAVPVAEKAVVEVHGAENVPRGAQKRRRAPDAKRAAAVLVRAPREAQLKDAAEKPAAKVVAARRRQGSVAAVVLARVVAQVHGSEAAPPRARDESAKFPDRNTLSIEKPRTAPRLLHFSASL